MKSRLILMLFLSSLSLRSDLVAGEAKPLWQADWEQAMRAGEKEGEVAFYTLGDSHKYVQEFQKRYPKIKVKLVPGRGAELLSRIMGERRSGKYLADVARIGKP